jgi:hypothetical protein
MSQWCVAVGVEALPSGSWIAQMHHCFPSALLTSLAIVLLPAPSLTAQSIAPHWEGAMIQQGSVLPISLDFTPNNDTFTAKWSAPSMRPASAGERERTAGALRAGGR